MTQESIANKLTELFELFESGALSKEEYELLKSQIIGIRAEKNQKAKIDSKTIEEVRDNQQETESSSIEKSSISKKSNRIIAIIPIVIIGISIAIFLMVTKKDTIKYKSLPTNSLTELHLSGKVKSVTQTKALVIKRDGDLLRVDGEYEYSEPKLEFKGILNLEGWLIDIEGELKGSKDYLMSGSGKRTYKVDDNKRLIEKTNLNDELYNYQQSYMYNADGYLVKTEIVSKDGILNYKSTYEYDSDLNLIFNEERFFPLGREIMGSDITYTYNEIGHLIMEKKVDASPFSFNIDVLIYDENGRIVKAENYDGDDLFLFQTFKYDKRGNITELVTKRVNNSESFKESFEYEYDKKGNWTMQIRYANGVVESKTERTFEYY